MTVSPKPNPYEFLPEIKTVQDLRVWIIALSNLVPVQDALDFRFFAPYLKYLFEGERYLSTLLAQAKDSIFREEIGAFLNQGFPIAIKCFEKRTAYLKSIPYKDYLQTGHWQNLRQKALKRAKNKCQLCYSKQQPLDVHHRTYKRRGEEPVSDLPVLCRKCHTKFHDKVVK